MNPTRRSATLTGLTLSLASTLAACQGRPTRDHHLRNGEIVMSPSPSQAAAPTGVAAPRDQEQENKAVARRWSEELWGQGRLWVADEIVAPDYVRHDAGDPIAARGPADVKRLVAMLRGMLPDLRIEVEEMVASGDKVVSRYLGVATDTRGYLGLPPTGKTIRTRAMQMFRFAGGRIVESWAVRDDLGTLVQLGHLAAPGSPALPAQLARLGAGR